MDVYLPVFCKVYQGCPIGGDKGFDVSGKEDQLSKAFRRKIVGVGHDRVGNQDRIVDERFDGFANVMDRRAVQIKVEFDKTPDTIDPSRSRLESQVELIRKVCKGEVVEGE